MSGLERRAKRLVPILQLAEKNLSAALFERAQPRNPPNGWVACRQLSQIQRG